MTTPSAMQPTSSASSASPTDKYLNCMPADFMFGDPLYAGDLMHIVDAARSSNIVPQVVQAPTRLVDMVIELSGKADYASKFLPPEQASKTLTEIADGLCSLLTAVNQPIAAPIVATVPSDLTQMTRHDASNYDSIISLLGMEEEGDPVAEVERLIAIAQSWPEGWKLVDKKNCYSLQCDGEVIANLAGPDAQTNATILARLLTESAASSTAEQASDVRNEIIEQLALSVEGAIGYVEGVRIEFAGFIRQHKNPPQIPADTGNAPAEASEQDAIQSIADLLDAPNLFAQVYLAARLNQWPHDAAMEAGKTAEKDHGESACTAIDELNQVLREVLRTDELEAKDQT